MLGAGKGHTERRQLLGTRRWSCRSAIFYVPSEFTPENTRYFVHQTGRDSEPLVKQAVKTLFLMPFLGHQRWSPVRCSFTEQRRRRRRRQQPPLLQYGSATRKVDTAIQWLYNALKIHTKVIPSYPPQPSNCSFIKYVPTKTLRAS